MNYYKQGNAANADKIKAAFEKLGYDISWPGGSAPNMAFGAMTAQQAFAALIDKVSGEGTWDSNPYVFVYEFELLKGGE